MSLRIFLPSIFKPRFKRDGKQPADLVVLSARVVTCDRGNPRAEALAVKGERIVYVGDNRGARDYIGPDTRVLNARRRMITPGFIDSHAHVLWIGAMLALMTTELYQCNSMEEVESLIVDYARENPDMPFVMGLGWRYDYIPGGLPTKEMLDSVIADRPTVLWSYGGQTGWLNTAMFELMRERNPEALERLVPELDEQTGEPTGLLLHFHSFNPFEFFTGEELDEVIRDKMMSKVRETLDEAVSVGVTTMNDVQIYRPFVPMILKFREDGGLDKVRVRCSYYVDRDVLDYEEAFRENLTWWKEVGESESDSHLLMGDSVKFYIDGVSGNYTAFMLDPYPDRPGCYGDPVWTQKDFDRVVAIIDSLGLQACTHSCGDAGVRRVINSYENAQKVNGRRDSRHRIEHCDSPRPEDQARIGELGICVATQPAHFFAVNESVESFLGPERIDQLMPWRSLEDEGILLSFGSDWCNSPLNPVYGMLLSATRMNYKGETNWAPEQKIELENAIRHWTIDSAKALFMEDEIGSIEVGKLADFVIFNENLLKLTSWWFILTHELELGALDDFVDTTFVGGRVVYQKGRGNDG